MGSSAEEASEASSAAALTSDCARATSAREEGEEEDLRADTTLEDWPRAICARYLRFWAVDWLEGEREDVSKSMTVE